MNDALPKPHDLATLTCSCGRPSEHESGSCMVCIYRAELEACRHELRRCDEARLILKTELDAARALANMRAEHYTAALARVAAFADVLERVWDDLQVVPTTAHEDALQACVRHALETIETALTREK